MERLFIRRQFDVNVIGLLETTKALLPHFRVNRDGIIINISSIGGRMTFPLGTLYHGTKFAVEGLSEALTFEMGAIGVRVKIVEPGAIKTDFAGRSFDFTTDESLVEYREYAGKVIAGLAPMMANSGASRTCLGTMRRMKTPASWSAKRCAIWNANRKKPIQHVAPNTERQPEGRKLIYDPADWRVTMATVTYNKAITGLLVIDPYNDFISEGGKLWDRLRSVAEANRCVRISKPTR